MAALKPIPNPFVPVVDDKGCMTQAWFEYFKTRELAGIANLSDVSPTAPTNGQVLIYNSTTLKYTPGTN